MSQYKIVKLSNVTLELKLPGEYNKFIVAKNIAKAVNLAKSDGFTLNDRTWKSVWNRNLSKWDIDHDFNQCGILAAVLMYSDCNFFGPKLEVVAHILGVEKEWILGFLNSLNGTYSAIVNKTYKRKTKKGQQCKDGREFGRLFKLAYLPEDFLPWYFSTTSEESFNTHNWEILEENKIFTTLGMNYNPNIKKCSTCNMFGGIAADYVYSNNIYYINDTWDSMKFKQNSFIDLSCNEIIIKRLLS